MGFDKFRLPFGQKTFLECVVEKLATSVDGPIIAAASKRTVDEVKNIQSAMALERFKVVVDQYDNSGPLEGIRTGLELARMNSKWAFVTSCDVPLLCPEILSVLQRAVESIDDPTIEAAMPTSSKRIYGMTAIYRCSVVDKVSAMIKRKQLRVSDLATELNTARISLDAIRAADPDLDSMKNLNSPEQYLELLQNRGLNCSPEIEAQLANTDNEK